MELAGPTVCKATAHPLQTILNHWKLVATIFPRSVTAETRDARAVGDEDQEMLHCAASQGMLSLVLELLADEKHSCDLADRFSRTPLHWAAEQGHRNVVLALLKAGACVDPRSQRRSTPIMLAASRGHVEVVRVLLNFRAGQSDCWSLNGHRRGIGHWRSTALHCAAAGGHVRVVEALLDAGFDRGQHDGAGLIPAEVSARQCHTTSPAITHLLLPSDMGGKLVHDYVNMTIQDVAMISGLVKGGAFLDWQDGTGDTPLHKAVHFDHIIISRVLLQAGADPNIRDCNGASPLHIAACTGHWEIVSDLLEAGADMEPLSVGGPSALHRAVVNNRANIVSLLLNAGASMEHCDGIRGQTPLSWACERCLAPIVRVLVEAGANVEARSLAGLTPLHWACRFNDAESVEVLLSAGADPSAVDQVAADAVASSSPGSGTMVSMPVAIDVIGLGYPFDCTDDSRRTSVTLAARRLDVVSVRRIETALKGAKQERSWRRRGWLIILSDRRASLEKLEARGEGWVVDRGGCAHIRSRCVERPQCADKVKYARHCDAQHPQDEWGDDGSLASKRSRNVDGLMIATGTSCQGDLTHAPTGSQDNMDVLLADLVGGLFRLAAVEEGLFRTVVMLI